VPQKDLLKYIEGIGDGDIGMDCSVVPLKYEGLYLISTTDYFYPLVDDPYMQGMIGCANVLSDMYSMGVVECDNILMILAASVDMTQNDRDIVSRQLIEGFNHQATLANTKVTGGQTVLNPWPIIGGAASSVCRKEDFIMPENAEVGDVLVLTKPMGNQVAVNVSQWRYNEEKWAKISDLMTKDDAKRAYEFAMFNMARLNKNAAILMHKYNAHGATDVTGFGLFGHGNNLARNQKRALKFVVHTLPIIANMAAVDEKVKIWNLLKGLSAETSGGLLICMKREDAVNFCKEIEELDKSPAWIIGDVVASESSDRSHNSCTIAENPKLLSI